MGPDAPSGNWLVRDGRVLAAVEVVTSRADRRRGLLGRAGLDGAMVLTPARSVHTFGMRFPIDVAHLDGEGTVLRTTRMVPNRLGSPVVRARAVLECEAGALARWGVAVGDALEIR